MVALLFSSEPMVARLFSSEPMVARLFSSEPELSSSECSCSEFSYSELSSEPGSSIMLIADNSGVTFLSKKANVLFPLLLSIGEGLFSSSLSLHSSGLFSMVYCVDCSAVC